MTQRLPVGLQAKKKILHLVQSAQGACENCTKDLKPTWRISAFSRSVAQEPQNATLGLIGFFELMLGFFQNLPV